MWEAIASNRLRSRLLIGLLGALLVGLGFVIGMAADPHSGGALGALLALAVWLGLWVVAILQGQEVLLTSVGAHEVQKEDAPQLWNVVEEMTIAAGLPRMPRVYVIDDDSPNAFAAGSRPDRAVLAVTSGLLKRLDRDELQGVVAHEIGHIKNLDIRFMTLAAVTLGAVLLISDLFLRGLWYGGGSRRRRSKDEGGAQALFLIIAVVVAVLAPVCAQVLYFASSRRREYLADASGALFTRYPAGLASALEKIAAQPPAPASVNRAIAPLLTVNPLQGSALSGVFSSHPPTEKRIAVLRSMGGGAGLADYEAAFRKVAGGKPLLQPSTMAQAAKVAARPPSPETKEDAVARGRDVAGLLDRMGGLIAIPCPCGVTIKVPGGVEHAMVPCPRCGREHAVPSARESAPAAAEVPSAPAAEAAPVPAAGNPSLPPLRFERKGGGWESFRCPCGGVVQVSPSFAGTSLQCPRCLRQVDVVAMKA